MRASPVGRLGAALVVLGVVLASCAPAPDPTAPLTPSPTPIAEPLRDAIVVGMMEEPDTLFAPLATTLGATTVLGTLHLGLTQRNERDEYVPRIAERTPTLENGGAVIRQTADGRDQLVVTYRIREGARFSNGQQVTSEDVKFSWELYLDPRVAVVSRAVAERYERIDTPDPRTVEVVYRPGELDQLYYAFCCYIVPKDVVGAIPPEQLAGSALAREPVYAGPYRVTSWEAGERITVESVDDFWLGTPRTREIVFRFLSDADALLAELRDGGIDIATGAAFRVERIPELDALVEEGLRPRYTPSLTWERVDLNLRDPRDLSRPHPILGERPVRQAIAHAVDRLALVAEVLHGKAEPVPAFILAPSWAAASGSDVMRYLPDPEQAGQLLEEAGWMPGEDGVRARDGARLEVRLLFASGEGPRERSASLVAEALRGVGFQVEVEPLAPASLLATGGAGSLSAGAFDLAMYPSASAPDPRAATYACEGVPTPQNGFRGENFPGYCDDEFDQLLRDAATRLLRAEARDLYVQAQQAWVRDLPVLPLYRHLQVEVARAGLRNFRPAGARDLTPLTWNSFEWELPEG